MMSSSWPACNDCKRGLSTIYPHMALQSETGLTHHESVVMKTVTRLRWQSSVDHDRHSMYSEVHLL